MRLDTIPLGPREIFVLTPKENLSDDDSRPRANPPIYIPCTRLSAMDDMHSAGNLARLTDFRP